MSDLIATALVAARAGLTVAYVARPPRHAALLTEITDLVATNETLVVTRTVGQRRLQLRNGGVVQLITREGERLATTDVLVFDRAH